MGKGLVWFVVPQFWISESGHWAEAGRQRPVLVCGAAEAASQRHNPFPIFPIFVFSHTFSPTWNNMTWPGHREFTKIRLIMRLGKCLSAAQSLPNLRLTRTFLTLCLSVETKNPWLFRPLIFPIVNWGLLPLPMMIHLFASRGRHRQKKLCFFATFCPEASPKKNWFTFSYFYF